MTQELGKITAADGTLDYSKYPLGSRLFLYPHHVSSLMKITAVLTCTMLVVYKYSVLCYSDFCKSSLPCISNTMFLKSTVITLVFY